MIQPKVSVIIPCYKVEKYLDRCVESVINQTLKDLEIILVDDESPDHVPEICDEWALKDARIKVIHKKNGGLGMACNSGIEVATGKYVAFLDSDDWIDANMYQTMYDTAEKHQAQMVFTGLRRVDTNGNVIGYLTHKEKFQIYEGKNEIDGLACDLVASEVSLAAERTLQMSAKVVLYSKSTIDENHLRFVSEREVMSEDMHFNLNMLSHSQCVCVVPRFFYNYRCTTGSITQKVDLDQFERIKSLYFFTLKECQILGIEENIYQRIQRFFIGYVRNYIRVVCRSKSSISEQIRIIQMIVNDPVWNIIWLSYPIHVAPLKQRLFVKLIQKKRIRILKILLKYK